jgi:hypothetical protein
VPSLQVSSDFGITRTKNDSLEDPFVTPLEHRGDRLIFQRKTSDGAIEYRPEVSVALTRVYYYAHPQTLDALTGKITFQGFLVVQADDSREIYSEDPQEAEGFVSKTVNDKPLVFTATRMPMLYQIAPSGDTIKYEYRKFDDEGRSYLSSVEFAGGRARYDLQLDEPPFGKDRVSYSAGFAQRQARLYTSVVGSFDGQPSHRSYFAYRSSDGAQMSSMIGAARTPGVTNSSTPHQHQLGLIARAHLQTPRRHGHGFQILNWRRTWWSRGQ